MPNEPVFNTADLNFAVLDDESVTYTSADHPAEKSKKPVGLAAYAEGRSSATEDTVDVERKK